ncbi:uncharacterized protein RCC_03970 [Ramularia collo-cygni]|uniref:Uncharacterized protein n=1 Tax=Ramularia collo-cygni TaxID=112498 RepID=A0A2D3UY63_9PEZI|nr:uncharacterized protein RCC_03970 [Ramularia collo-cygni]CZT18130.1 uncharacterized protein RCC_03970 [Ramularia collo-cygni]
MSNMTSCPARADIPLTWASVGTAIKIAACSVPDCDNNAAALSLCCNRYSSNQSTPDSFNGISGIYLTCIISSDGTDFNETSTQNSDYQNFQDCLVQEGAAPLLCNRPREERQDEPTPYDCPVLDQDSITAIPPARLGVNATGDVVCGLRNVPNATAVLRNCCGESPLQAYGLGCFASCAGNSSLEQCIEDGYDYEGEGNGPACVTLDDTLTNTGSSGVQGGLKAWLVGGLLMIVVAMS